MPAPEHHKSHRSGWLRAAVLGANDGIVSTASLIIGVASAQASKEAILLAGVAGLVAGAMSMAAGEYVSVSSQADMEQADIELERHALEHHYQDELEELSAIYEGRGLDSALARQVAEQLMAHDALEAHTRDEIGILDMGKAKPILAATSSALAFTLGALLPLGAAWLAPLSSTVEYVAPCSLLFLACLGVLAAWAGGAPRFKGALRVTLWGGIAMTLTALVGRLFDVVV